MIKRIMATVLMGSLLGIGMDAAEASDDPNCRVAGTWLVDVSFPGPPNMPEAGLRFKEILTLNADETLTETNGSLHENTPLSANPPGIVPIIGSDGRGAWNLKSFCRIDFAFLKFVFNAVDFMPEGAPAELPAGTHIGYLRVSGKAKIRGDMFLSNPGDVSAELLLGPDPLSPLQTVPFGSSTSTGFRLLAK